MPETPGSPVDHLQAHGTASAGVAVGLQDVYMDGRRRARSIKLFNLLSGFCTLLVQTTRGTSPYRLHRTFLQPQTSPWPQPSRLAGPTSEGWQVMRASHAAADARIVPAVTSSTIHPVAG